MTYNGVTYYYVTNLQGDVVGLLDGNGNRMISYHYTAYGQGYINANESSMTATLASVNPLGYRSYVHDLGTGLYYLQSRYYDPAVGRFINADGLVSTGQGFTGNNMFAYCLNNPVNFVDRNGMNAEAIPLDESIAEAIKNGLIWLGEAVVAAAPYVFLALCDLVLVLSCSGSAKQKEETLVTEQVQTPPPEPREYSVYFLSTLMFPDKIIYVGRVKTANFDKRMKYHESKGRVLSWHLDGLTYTECRGVEQIGMMYYHSVYRNGGLNNQINGVSLWNPNKGIYLRKGYEYITRSFENIPQLASSNRDDWYQAYLRNFLINEFLNIGG